jgi:hypothetical protein
VQRRAAADRAHHLHPRALAVGALDVDDFVALAHRQVDRLAGEAMQLAHRHQRGVAYRQPRLHQVAELEQPHAEPVGAGVGAVDEAAGHHVVENAVRRRRMQFRALREFLQTDGVAVRGERVQQPHHPFDHLDRGFGIRGGLGHIGGKIGGESVDASSGLRRLYLVS